MKQKLLAIAAIVAVTALTSTSRADIYTDTTGDLNTGTPSGENLSGLTHLDITSVEVTNTATDIVFKIKLAGNPVATDWGKYCIGVDTNPATGDLGSNGNGWGRKISMNPRGMDFWVGSWVDGTPGAELFNYDGIAWNNIGGPTTSKTTNSVTISFPFASLGKAFGDTVDFDIYTTGGGTDPAIDALNNPGVAVTSWADFYTNNNVSSYTLQTVTAVPHSVSFVVDMGVPIWEYDNLTGPGFSTNVDLLYVRGSFNGWGTTSSDQLFQIGSSTIYSNTITMLATPGDAIQYKFEGFSFPGYESPVLIGGGNRNLTLTNLSMAAPFACFGDRCLTNPPVSTVNFEVDMSVAQNFGAFDPNVNGVTLPGSFNGWNTTALLLTPKAAPDTNIYTNSLTFSYYPLGVQNVGFYKFYITSLTNPNRNNGWESPISNNGGNRAFGIASANQTLSFVYNDENPVINAAVEQLNATDVKISFNSFPARGNPPEYYPTGGVYAVESRTSLTAPWTTNAIIHSTTGTTAITNTGVLPGTPQQFYRVGLIGL